MQRPPTTGRVSAALAYTLALALLGLGTALMLSDRFDDYVPVSGARRTALAAWLMAHGLGATAVVWARRSLPLLHPPITILLAAFLVSLALIDGAAFANLFIAGWAIFQWDAQTMWVAVLAVLAGILNVISRMTPLLDPPPRVDEKNVIGLYALISPRYRLRAVLGQFGWSVIFMASIALSFTFFFALLLFQIALGRELFLAREEPTLAAIERALQAASALPPVILIVMSLFFVMGVLYAAYDAYKSWRQELEPLD